MKGLDKLIDKSISYLESSEAFLSEQVPEFCKQLMEYHAWGVQVSYDISFWFALFFFVFATAFFLRALFTDNNDGDVYLWGGIVTGTVFIITFGICVNDYKDLKMYKIAPKVFFIKTLKEMAVK